MNNICLILFLSLLSSTAAYADRWEEAEKGIKKFKPSHFSHLPPHIEKKLQAIGCIVPQATMGKSPNNVIQGHFASKQSLDWAVLCSKNGKSTLHIIWEKNTPCPSAIEEFTDRTYLQDMGEGKIEFSRSLNVAKSEYISRQQKRYGGLSPKKLDHEGIEDIFIEKASSVHYCEDGKWLKLTGAD